MLGIPSLIYAVVSLLIPLTRDYSLLLALCVIHGLLLGTFVPATLMIIFRNLPMKWWLPAIALYSIRVGFTLNSGISLVGFYVDTPRLAMDVLAGHHYRAAVGIVCLSREHRATPSTVELLSRSGLGRHAPSRHWLCHDLRRARSGQSSQLAGIRYDRCSALGRHFSSRCASSSTKSLVKSPWAHVQILFSRNIGLSLVVILLYTLTSLSNSSLAPNFLIAIAQLRPEQTGWLFLIYGVPADGGNPALSIYLMRRIDPRIVSDHRADRFCGGRATWELK